VRFFQAPLKVAVFAMISSGLVVTASAADEVEADAAQKASAPANAATKAGSSSSFSSSFPSSNSNLSSGFNPNASTPASAPATSTATLSALGPPAGKRKIKGEFLSLNSVGITNLKDESGSVSALNFVGVRYAVNPKNIVAVRQQFSFDYPKADQDMKVKTEDLYIAHTRPGLGKFLGDGDITLQTRLYLPTGEDSRNFTEHHGVLNPRVFMSKTVSNSWTLGFNTYLYFYNQSKDTFIDARGREVGNNDFRALPFFSASYGFAKNFSFDQAIGFDGQWKRQVPGKTASRTGNAYLDSSVSYVGIKQVILTAGLSQLSAFNNETARDRFAPYREAETQLYFQFLASL